jgi:hypothetical protein
MLQLRRVYEVEKERWEKKNLENRESGETRLQNVIEKRSEDLLALEEEII